MVFRAHILNEAMTPEKQFLSQGIYDVFIGTSSIFVGAWGGFEGVRGFISESRRLKNTEEKITSYLEELGGVNEQYLAIQSAMDHS